MSGLSDRFIVPGGLFLLALMAASAGALCAHTIPVSYLTVVPDKEFVHLELVVGASGQSQQLVAGIGGEVL